ncbi:hypothetical protein BS78_01G119200 [Paspalum vaginatum]|nr:hypothetical protein BS78_01G119200 [Paspalum vaginatum]
MRLCAQLASRNIDHKLPLLCYVMLVAPVRTLPHEARSFWLVVIPHPSSFPPHSSHTINHASWIQNTRTWLSGRPCCWAPACLSIGVLMTVASDAA